MITLSYFDATVIATAIFLGGIFFSWMLSAVTKDRI